MTWILVVLMLGQSDAVEKPTLTLDFNTEKECIEAGLRLKATIVVVAEYAAQRTVTACLQRTGL